MSLIATVESLQALKRAKGRIRSLGHALSWRVALSLISGDTTTDEAERTAQSRGCSATVLRKDEFGYPLASDEENSTRGVVVITE